MTNDKYKAALDALNKMPCRSELLGGQHYDYLLKEEVIAVFTNFIQLAQEAERVRKERDGLARYIVDQNKALNWHDLQCIRGVNFKMEILAKKANENENA